MKTLKEIRALNEATSLLPPMITFKRGAIRSFPGGMCAEYHSDTMNQSIIYPNNFSNVHK